VCGRLLKDLARPPAMKICSSPGRDVSLDYGSGLVRTGLGWQVDHVIGYLGFTLMFCFAWPRPVIVGAALILAAIPLEALQALTPDRCCDFIAVLYSVGGALAGPLLFDPCNRILQYLKARTRLIPGWLGAMLPEPKRRLPLLGGQVTRTLPSERPHRSCRRNRSSRAVFCSSARQHESLWVH
jgi:hypothetical protein